MLFSFDGYFEAVRDGNPIVLEMYERHYSCKKYADGRIRKLFCGPGEKMVLLSLKKDAVFVWRKFIDDSGQKGINCSIFRNEGKTKSSVLITEFPFITQQTIVNDLLSMLSNRDFDLIMNLLRFFNESYKAEAGNENRKD